jgi:hypothetical protein
MAAQYGSNGPDWLVNKAHIDDVTLLNIARHEFLASLLVSSLF